MAEADPSDARGSGCDVNGPPPQSAFLLECGGTGEQSSATPAKGSKPKRHDVAILKIAEVLRQEVVEGVHLALEEHLSRHEALLERHLLGLECAGRVLQSFEFQSDAVLSDRAPDAAAIPAPSLAPPPPPSPSTLPRPLFCEADVAQPWLCNPSDHEATADAELLPGAAQVLRVPECSHHEAAEIIPCSERSGDLLEIVKAEVIQCTTELLPESMMSSMTCNSVSRATSSMWSARAWAETLPLAAKGAIDAGQHRFEEVVNKEQGSGLVWEVVTSSCFDCVVCTTILLNAVFATMKADFDIQHPLDEDFTFVVCEYVFQAFFAIELGIKIWVYRIHFFLSEDLGWNCFDAILVLCSLVDQVIKNFVSHSGDHVASFSFMRAFRLLRVVKIFRLFRVVRFFRELYLMMASLVGALRSLFWSIVVIAFSLYIFALLFMQGVTSYFRDSLAAGVVIEEEDKFLGAFGSMALTMVTLFKCGTGGADWGEFYDLVSMASPLYAALFLLYVAFFGFAVVNVLTGMIVENVGENCRKTMEKDAEIARKKQEITEMKKRMREETEDAGGLLATCLPGWPMASTTTASRQVSRRQAVTPKVAPMVVVPSDASCCH